MHATLYDLVIQEGSPLRHHHDDHDDDRVEHETGTQIADHVDVFFLRDLDPRLVLPVPGRLSSPPTRRGM